MHRIVQPEFLDTLAPKDRRAVGSRADLRRLNWILGHAGILSRATGLTNGGTSVAPRSLRIVELGAGDGTLLLRMAQRRTSGAIQAQVTLVDQSEVVSPETRRAFATLNWSVELVVEDVFVWLARSAERVDVMVANLFLHHFSTEQLQVLLRLAARRTNCFAVCEPRRSRLSLAGAKLLRLIGCNAITRHDAVVSVRAGFAGRELSALWPETLDWTLREGSVGVFSHYFTARRNV